MGKVNPIGLKGIFQRSENSWQAEITFQRKQKHLGNFKTAEEAARAYDKAALECWGERAILNYPPAKK